MPSVGTGVGWKWSLGTEWRMVQAVFVGGQKWLLNSHRSAAKLLMLLPGWGWDGYNTLPWEKIWEKLPVAPVTALECRCPTQWHIHVHRKYCKCLWCFQPPGDCNPSSAGLISELLHSFELFQTSGEREVFTSGSAEVLLHPDSFRSGNLYIFISLLRTSQCWMRFEWSLNSWKRTNVFSKWLPYQLIFQQDRGADSSFTSKL